MITFPNAKINLGLNIVARRPDGYHNLETAFYPIALRDILEMVPAPAGAATSLATYGIAVECEPEKNLVVRAVRLMQSRYAVPDVEIHLTKNIPHGAGLGGGSSDAAFALVMLNEMFNLGLPKSTLAAHAATLGADCPFFVYNEPMMATGIGDRLAPISLSLAGKALYLVKPAVHVATAQAYSGVTPQPAVRSLADDLAAPVASWHRNVKNDFEPSVFKAHPSLAAIKRKIVDAGALYAAMSGSGASIFGIFDSANMAEQLLGTIPCERDFVINL